MERRNDCTDNREGLRVCDDIAEYKGKEPKFPLGRVVATQNAVAHLTELDIRAALTRHVQGDWGDVCEQDRRSNDWSLANGERLVSVYHSAAGVKFYIITERNRSATTVLLPEDY